MLPFSQSSENNKVPICKVLGDLLPEPARVLEIASGTGQHAVWFAEHLPHLTWLPSDVAESGMGLRERLEQNPVPNILPPVVLDVSEWPKPKPIYDAVFSANCIHIISWPKVISYIEGAAASLKSGGLMILYGPFRYDGDFTTESNASFDEHLKRQDTESGIRDFEAIDELACNNGLSFVKNIQMPANNQMIVWCKDGA